MSTRVLHVITGLYGGGAEAMLYSVLQHAPRADSQQVISLLDGGPYVERIAALGVPVHTLGMKRSRPSLHALQQFRTLVAHYRPDIVQGWMYHANILATLAGAPSDTRLIWCLHAPNLDLSSYHPLSRAVRSAGAWLSGRPDVIVANSEVTRRDHIQLGYHPRRWALIPNGFDLSRFHADAAARASLRAQLGLPPDAALIGLVGRYDAQKDLPTFLRAVADFARFQIPATFLLAGEGLDGENVELGREIDRLGIRQHIRLLGFREDIPRVTAALDIATSTSIAESFSNAIAEAMACEVPCVVTNAAYLPHRVSGAGLVVPVRDPAATAAAWRSLLQLEESARQQLGRAGRARIQNEFSLDLTVQRYQTLYREIRSRVASS